MPWFWSLPLLLLALAPSPARATDFECRGLPIPAREALAARGDLRGIYCLAYTRAAQYEAIDHTWQCEKVRGPAVAAVTRARQAGVTDDDIESLFQTGEDFCVTGDYQRRQQDQLRDRQDYMRCSADVGIQCRNDQTCISQNVWRCQ
jgi:hypothetical protein